MRRLISLPVLVILAAGSGCGRSPVSLESGPDSGQLTFLDQGGDGLFATRDFVPWPDLPCGCPPGSAWTIGSCVPTPELKQCVKRCRSSDPNPCPSGLVCDGISGTVDCGSWEKAGVCVPGPSMGFPPGALRITPTSGTAGKMTDMIVFGGDFYIGALHWIVDVGGNQPAMMGGARCEIRFKFTAAKPGVYPVTVGYGAKGQALAGFFTASNGVPEPKWIQPGFACGAGDTCAQGGSWRCACKAGRCVCDKK